MQQGVGNVIFGGWQVSAIINKSSGFPRDPATGTDTPNTGVGTYRPNLVSGQDPNDGATDAAAVVQHRRVRGAGTVHLRNAGRNIVMGPGIFTHGHVPHENVRFGGATSLQFRLEAFNAFNNPVWGDPDMTMSNSTLSASTPRDHRCVNCKSA